MGKQSQRPVFLNLFQIKLPPAGIVSVAHRISGFLMVLSAPLFIYLFALSLRNPAGFAQAQAWLSCVWLQSLMLLLCWSLAHHLLAGVRFLLLDVDIGIQREKINRSAWLVLVVSMLLALLLFVGLV